MSFEIVVKKRVFGVNEAAVQQELAELLTEYIPEFVKTKNATNIVSTTSTMGETYWSYGGSPFGFAAVGSYYKQTPSTGDDYSCIYISCASADIATKAGAAIGRYSTQKLVRETVSGVGGYGFDVTIIRVEGNYIIRIANKAYYLGFLHSQIVGQVFVFLDLSMIWYHRVTGSITYGLDVCRGCILDTGSYFGAYAGCIDAEVTNLPAGTVILSPLYVTLEDQCMEPLAIPGVYRFYGSAGPGYDVPVEAAGVEVLQVNAAPVVVARAKT